MRLAKGFFLLIIATSMRSKFYRPPFGGVGRRFSGECFKDKKLFKYKNLCHFITKRRLKYYGIERREKKREERREARREQNFTVRLLAASAGGSSKKNKKKQKKN